MIIWKGEVMSETEHQKRHSEFARSYKLLFENSLNTAKQHTQKLIQPISGDGIEQKSFLAKTFFRFLTVKLQFHTV